MPIWRPGRHIPTQRIPKCPPGRKVATAGNHLNPSGNGISALLESCVADQSCHNILFPQNSHHLTTDLTIKFACKWRDEFHTCTIENWTVVGRGYFSHTSSHSKNVASAHRVHKEVLSHESVITPKTISHGSLRKGMSHFTRIVKTKVKFWKFHE